MRDLGELQVAARAADKQLPTFGLEVEVRFASAERRNDFAEELAEAVARLVSRYHDECAVGGRTFRFCLGAYPKPAGREEK